MPGTRWLFNFSRPHLLISGLISWATGVQTRNFLPMPLSWHVSFHLEFSTWGSYIRVFDPFGVGFCAIREIKSSLLLLHVNIAEGIFFLSALWEFTTYVWNVFWSHLPISPRYPVLPGPYIKEAVVSLVNACCIFMKTQLLKLHTIMSWFSVLASGSACLFL